MQKQVNRHAIFVFELRLDRDPARHVGRWPLGGRELEAAICIDAANSGHFQLFGQRLAPAELGRQQPLDQSKRFYRLRVIP